ncbi:MAG: hypothetical protein IKS61_00125 [Aeriscardovia sp.]|nr:hypothetical protein [Aeriscardovia sp.]
MGVAAIAGVTGLGTMLSMVPASFADTLPSNNESQNTASLTQSPKKLRAASSAAKLSVARQGAFGAVNAAQGADGATETADAPDLAAANNTFATEAGNAAAAAENASESFSLVQQQAASQSADIQRDLKALYNDSTSPATGSLATDAQNFDSWARDWIAAANKGSAGYANYLEQLNAVISDIPMWENHGTLTVDNSADAEAVLDNLKIMKASVETLQNLMENCDTASMSPDQAFSTAQQDALMVNSKFQELQKFIRQSSPIAHDGGSGSVPGSVIGYGGQRYEAWPDGNPFGGYNSSYIWELLGNIQSTFLSKLSEYENPPAGWAQDYSNYKYLQSVEPYAEQISQDASSALAKAQDAAAKIAAAKELAEQNTGDAASDAAATAQAKQDVQDALQEIGEAKALEGEMAAAMNGALSQYAHATGASPTASVNGTAVDLPTATNENPLYSQSDISTIQAALSEAASQVNTLLSGSGSGMGSGGLLGSAGAWQKAISAQRNSDSAQKKTIPAGAQKASGDMQKAQKDLGNPKPDSAGRARIGGLPSIGGGEAIRQTVAPSSAEARIRPSTPASDLATTGSDAAAAAIGAAALLAAGVAAELLKKKGLKKEK